MTQTGHFRFLLHNSRKGGFLHDQFLEKRIEALSVVHVELLALEDCAAIFADQVLQNCHVDLGVARDLEFRKGNIT